jgi:PAS domain S-box-containing protein
MGGEGCVNLTVRLFVLALLAAAPAVAIEIWNQYDLRRARSFEMQRQVMTLARLQTAEIDRIAEGARQFLVALAQIPQIRDREACNALLRQIRENYLAYRALIAADADGGVICSSIGPGPPIPDREYFRMAKQSGDFAIGEYVMGRGTGAAAIHFSYPLRNDGGKIGGVIAAALDLDWFADRLRDKLPPNATLNVADRNGTILVRLPDNERWRGQKIPEAFHPIIYSLHSGMSDVTSLDGLRQVLGYVPIPASETGLYVGVAINRNAVFADLNRASLRGAVVIALGAALSLLLAWSWGQQGITRPVNDLLATVESWRAGHYARSSRRWTRTELGQLGQAFDELATTVSDRERRLRASETRLKERESYLSLVLERVPVGIVQTGADGAYKLVNRTFCEIVQRPESELLRMKFIDITHADDVAQDAAQFAESMRTRQAYVHRKRYIRPDGSIVWTENTVNHLDNPDDGILATVVELTERLRAEEQQQRLINELNHRVKNTLASVQALTTMSGRYAASTEALVGAVTARLMALSATHNLLTEGLWRSAALRDIVEAELRPYAHPGERLRVTGEPVELKPRQAIGLGMVFHELATNAAKYGALSVLQGRVQVSWSTLPGAEGRRLHLEWREEGGPAPAAGSSRGFGSRLIEQSIADFQGTLQMQFLPTGLHCVFEVVIDDDGAGGLQAVAG